MFGAPNLPRGFLIALTALTLFLLVFGVWKVTDEVMFASQAETALGTIQEFAGNRARVRYKIEKDLREGPLGNDADRLLSPRGQINMYQPEVEAARLPILTKGEEVEVLFRPDKPQDARLAGVWQRYSNPGIALLAALLLACLVVPAWRKRAGGRGGAIRPAPSARQVPRKKKRK